MSLTHIQEKLKVPKGQYNNFGKYNYRSCEDIVEAVKPLLREDGAYLLMTDELVMLGDRYYVKAIATVHFKDGNTVSATGYAREPESKKGMDASQITGTASSYARKLALSGLFALDETESDPDTGNNRDVVLDDDIVNNLTAAKDLQGLQKAWIAIPEDDRDPYIDIKNQMKEKLSEAED